MAEKGSKHALLVLGMHRSGTSMLTRILNLKGVALAQTLTQANEYNEKGYWESLEVQRINDEIFHHFHTAWFDSYSIPINTLSPDKFQYFVNRILSFLKANFDSNDVSTFAIKDPRICKTFPIWQVALESFGAKMSVILPYRSPFEVAASLQFRDKIPVRTGLLMWLRYVIDAERYTRGITRTAVSFDSLLDDWELTIRRAEQKLAFPFPISSAVVSAEITDFISSNLKHHSHLGATSNSWGTVGEHAARLHALLKGMEAEKDSGAIFQELSNSFGFFREVSDSCDYSAPEWVTRHLNNQLSLKLISASDVEAEEQILGLKTSRIEHAYKISELGELNQKLQIKTEEQTLEAYSTSKEIEDLIEVTSIQKKEITKLKRKKKRAFKQLKKTKQKIDMMAAQNSIVVARHDKQMLENGDLKSLVDKLNNEKLSQAEQIDGHRDSIAQLESEVTRLEAAYKKQLSTRFKVFGVKIGLWEWRKSQGADKPRSEFGPLTTKVANLLINPVKQIGLRRDANVVRSSSLFNRTWYLESYPEILEAGIDPALHYVMFGANEGRNPGPDFDTVGYLRENPDVALENINPMVHYEKFGKQEGRSSKKEECEA